MPKTPQPSQRILAIDIGNTSITGAWVDARVQRVYSISTQQLSTQTLKRIALYRLNRAPVVIASVVPGKAQVFQKFFRKRVPVHVLSSKQIPMRNLTRHPQQVGIDRLINAYEAYCRYGRACVAVDFGTATTFDVVSARGEYVGGLIAPGVDLTLNALAERAALLPRIALKHPGKLIGKDTVHAIQAGCSFGLGGLCDGILTRLRHRYPFCPIVATGGYAQFIARYANLISTIDNHLILKGLHRIFTLHKHSRILKS